MKNFDYSFYQFSASAPTDTECVFKLPQKTDFIDMQFYLDFEQVLTGLTIDVLEVGGSTITGVAHTKTLIVDTTSHIRIFTTVAITNLKCFYLRLNYTWSGGSAIVYSNLFYRDDTTQAVKLVYHCFEPQFGFPFDTTKAYYVNVVTVPIIVNKPNFPQEDKVYIDGNGVRRLLSSKIDKEFELEVDYICEDWHEAMVVALGCDSIQFDSVFLQKSAPYEIDYANEILLSCGLRLNKASAKLTKNTTIRNNNC